MSCSPASVVYGTHTAISAIRCSGHEALPFTGAHLFDLGLVGAGLVILGLAARSLATKFPKGGA